MESHPGFIEEIDASEMDLKDPVGKGSFGVVYMAIWRGIHVAVKMIESESERTAFMTELKQLSRVSHPNIIRLYGACTNPVSLVMEFAECGSLYQLLHGPGPQAHYTSGHAMSWCLQCAKGVAYLHGMKPKALIHRDLKPPNLLLTNVGTVLKICDFGTACDQHTYMTNNKGSAAWMAPEVFEGEQYSEKCDVFSWGIILWEVLTRRKPFDELGGPAFRIMWAVHTGTRPNIIQNCPKPVEDLMTRCWSQDPDVRPSMDEVLQEMTDLLVFFPGGNDPLIFPHNSENDDSIPSSGASSTYDYTGGSDSLFSRDTHMGTISDTVRKSLYEKNSPSTVITTTNKSAAYQHQQDIQVPPVKEMAFEARNRSRSHTPDPQKSTLDQIPPSESGRRTRRSSSDLIAEIEQQPITPLGSRSASPVSFGRPTLSGHLSNMTLSNKRPAASHTPPIVVQPMLVNPTTSNEQPQLVLPAFPSFIQEAHDLSNSSDCESLPRAYLTLELHLQPLPPSASSKESMEVYQEHCLLAEEYLRVQTEIKYLNSQYEKLQKLLDQDEHQDVLKMEHQRLNLENKSLRTWHDKMKADLQRVRESQQRNVQHHHHNRTNNNTAPTSSYRS